MRKGPTPAGRRVLLPLTQNLAAAGVPEVVCKQEANHRANHRGPENVESDDDERSSDDDSVITILTELSWDDDETPPSADHHQDRITKGSLQHRFAKLQQIFDKRDRMLERLANAQNPALVALLRKQEIIVRQQERELLLLRHLGTKDCTGTYHADNHDCDDADDSILSSSDDSTIWYEAKEIPAKDAVKEVRGLHQHPTYSFVTTRTFTLFEWMYYVVLFEYHIGAPAVASLFIHSLAHAGLYDVVTVFCIEFRKACDYYLLGNQKNHEYLEYGILCGLGVCMIRSSGYLYWWLNIQDYNLVKLDLHNRLRLGFWGARCMVWVKRRPVLRALLFMVGYNICYQIMFEMYDKWYNCFMTPDGPTADLGDDHHQDEAFCLADGTLSVAQSWLLSQPESGLRTCTTVHNQLDYIWKTLYFKTFEQVWSSWMEAIVKPAFDPILSVLVFLSVTCACVLVLSYYGFDFFDKY